MVSENGGVELVVTCGVCGQELGRSEGDLASVPHVVCQCSTPEIVGGESVLLSDVIRDLCERAGLEVDEAALKTLVYFDPEVNVYLPARR